MLERIRIFFLRLLTPKPSLELSFSRISAFRYCPWKYKLLYLDGYKTPPTPQISLGNTIHRTLEDFHKHGGQTLDDLMDVYNQDWVNEGFQNPQQTMQYYEKGEKMLSDYFEWSQLRKSEIVAIEKEFRFPVGRRMLRGIVDRIDKLPDDTLEVIDYKTHAEMWDQARIDSDLQLTLYAIGAEKMMNQTPALLSYYFLAHNQVVSTTRSKEQMQAALVEMESVAKKIEANDFKPNTAQCPKCDFRQTCKFSTARGPAAANGIK